MNACILLRKEREDLAGGFLLSSPFLSICVTFLHPSIIIQPSSRQPLADWPSSSHPLQAESTLQASVKATCSLLPKTPLLHKATLLQCSSCATLLYLKVSQQKVASRSYSDEAATTMSNGRRCPSESSIVVSLLFSPVYCITRAALVRAERSA